MSAHKGVYHPLVLTASSAFAGEELHRYLAVVGPFGVVAHDSSLAVVDAELVPMAVARWEAYIVHESCVNMAKAVVIGRCKRVLRDRFGSERSSMMWT